MCDTHVGSAGTVSGSAACTLCAVKDAALSMTSGAEQPVCTREVCITRVSLASARSVCITCSSFVYVLDDDGEDKYSNATRKCSQVTAALCKTGNVTAPEMLLIKALAERATPCTHLSHQATLLALTQQESVTSHVREVWTSE